MSICLCQSARCRAPTKRVSGELVCGRTAAVEEAAVAGVREANPGAMIPEAFACDGATVARVLAEHGLEVRPIRKARQVRP